MRKLNREKEKDNNIKCEYDIMRKSEWYKERFIGFPKYLKFMKVFVLCENMKDFLQNVDKSGYVIELFWSGMAKDEDWIVHIAILRIFVKGLKNSDKLEIYTKMYILDVGLCCWFFGCHGITV